MEQEQVTETLCYKVCRRDSSTNFEWTLCDECFNNRINAIEFAYKEAQQNRKTDYRVIQVYMSEKVVYWYDHIGHN